MSDASIVLRELKIENNLRTRRNIFEFLGIFGRFVGKLVRDDNWHHFHRMLLVLWAIICQIFIHLMHYRVANWPSDHKRHDVCLPDSTGAPTPLPLCIRSGRLSRQIFVKIPRNFQPLFDLVRFIMGRERSSAANEWLC